MESPCGVYCGWLGQRVAGCHNAIMCIWTTNIRTTYRLYFIDLFRDGLRADQFFRQFLQIHGARNQSDVSERLRELPGEAPLDSPCRLDVMRRWKNQLPHGVSGYPHDGAKTSAESRFDSFTLPPDMARRLRLNNSESRKQNFVSQCAQCAFAGKARCRWRTALLIRNDRVKRISKWRTE